MSDSIPPKTRQKSCIPCAASKRKCGQEIPACARCLSKSIPCEYKSALARRKGENANPPAAAGDYNDTIMDFEAGSATSSPQELLTGPGLLMSTPGIATATDQTSNVPVDDSFFTVYDNRLLVTPYPEILEIGVMDRERIRYCVRSLKSYPYSLVHSGKNSFIHPQAYQPVMPLVLQDAVSAASLYLLKNEINENMVWDIITAKVTQLTGPRGPWSVAEHLACVQALIIFQIIRLFDGDIKQRSDAEQQEDLLTSWTESLIVRTGVNTSSSSAVERGWESWVFEEAISRTVIISQVAQAMFAIQRQGFCTMVGAVTSMSFTAQRRLWEAPRESHWVKACNESRKFWIERMNFKEMMEKGTVDDLDELAWLMLVTYKGVDAVNEWILSKGGSNLIE